jgi:predicted TIM-barrel fold metal-dependent hydrolase
MRFVDAHHHLWDLNHCHYPWLMAEGVKRFFGDPAPIQKNYLASDFLSEDEKWQPDKSVHIQVGVQESDSLKESQWLQQVFEQAGVPNGIIAYADLSSVNAQQQLDQQSAVSNVRGIRQIVGRHPVEDLQHGTDSLLGDIQWRAGLSLLDRFGLSFDLQLIPPQYEQAFSVFSTLPGLKMAICHAGSPWDQSPEGLKHWRQGMKNFARLPNVYCKVSGLGMFNHDWSPEDIKPIVLDAIDIFGSNRVMFGSNFPVDSLYNSYAHTWNAYDEITTGFSDSERRRLFAENAEQFYRI